MDIAFRIREFHEKLEVPLFEDLRRTLEVTCHKSGEDNHGSNFIGNAVVLMGIEVISQFICPDSEEALEQFNREAKEVYDKLDNNSRKYLDKKHTKIDGSQLSKKFMKEYFGDWFAKQKEFDVPIRELIWMFRNPHAHSFYPHYQKNTNKKLVTGAVDWLYKDEGHRVGIKISEIENSLNSYKSSLYVVDGDTFRIRPQVLFVFVKKAVSRYIQCVQIDKEVMEKFSCNYDRLAVQYGFVTELT